MQCQKMHLFAQNMHLISPYFPTILKQFVQISSKIQSLLNPSFLWAYSALIGQKAQSIVIGLPCTPCVRNVTHCHSSVFLMLIENINIYYLSYLHFEIQWSQLVQINWIMSRLSRVSVLWIPRWTPWDQRSSRQKNDGSTHTHTHTCWFLWFMGTLHRRNGFYTEQTVCAIALHLPYT